MSKMNSPVPKKNNLPRLTNTQVAQIERLARVAQVIVRIVLQMLVGLILTLLFSLVVLGVLLLAARSSTEQSLDLLKTLLMIMASTITGVTGYLYGRSSEQK